MLEDEFVDVFRKARLGTKLDDAALAAKTGSSAADVAAWGAGRAVPSDAEARELAHALGLDPAKFADSAAVRWHPDVAFPAHVTTHLQRSMPNSNGYLLRATDGTAAVVDPAGDPAALLETIAASGCDLRYILITHRHADHCESTAHVLAAHPRAEIVIGTVDAAGIGALASTATKVADGDVLPFGDESIRALATPGHTDGSICYLAGEVLFTGDTLFAGSVGGAYGDRSTYLDILRNVRTKLLSLGPDVTFMPGHGPISTIGEELAHNPFFTF